MTNLEYFIKEIGWQGGTIHQVSEELNRVRKSELHEVANLLDMSSGARELVIALYRARKGE